MQLNRADRKLDEFQITLGKDEIHALVSALIVHGHTQPDQGRKFNRIRNDLQTQLTGIYFHADPEVVEV